MELSNRNLVLPLELHNRSLEQVLHNRSLELELDSNEVLELDSNEVLELDSMLELELDSSEVLELGSKLVLLEHSMRLPSLHGAWRAIRRRCIRLPFLRATWPKGLVDRRIRRNLLLLLIRS